MKKSISKKDVMDFLLHYDYPGNVRELKNIIDRMVVLSDNGHVKSDNISNLLNISEPDHMEDIFESNFSLRDIRREVESKYIENVLKKNSYNITKSAKDLDISTRHLFNKILEYGIKEHSGGIQGMKNERHRLKKDAGAGSRSLRWHSEPWSDGDGSGCRRSGSHTAACWGLLLHFSLEALCVFL